MKKESALIKGIDLYNKRKYMEAKNEREVTMKKWKLTFI